MKCRRLLLIGLLAPACASPNIYGTARTLGRGKVQHAIALEGIGARSPDDAGYLPNLPTYNLRIGLSERVDLGLRLTNLTGVALTSLVALRRGRLDLALAPSVQGSWTPRSAGHPGWVSAQAPLLIAYNVSPRWTLMATEGVGLGQTLGRSTTAPPTAKGNSEAQGANAGGFYVRSGIAVQLRLTRHFALQPEVTVLVPTNRKNALFFTGLGFVFGAMPNH